MIRTVALTLAAGIAAGVVSSCAPTTATPADEAFAGPRNTESPIAGTTLRCPQDYPDSRLVFAPDGTLSGRYAGHDVSGEWTALGPGRVEVLVRAGGIAVRDTMRQTAAGWRGENTACG
jgi:alkaline phosphatase